MLWLKIQFQKHIININQRELLKMGYSWFPFTARFLVSPVAKILAVLPFTMSLGFEDLYSLTPCKSLLHVLHPYLYLHLSFQKEQVESVGEILHTYNATDLQLLQRSTPTFQPLTIWPGKCNCFI